MRRVSIYIAVGVVIFLILAVGVQWYANWIVGEMQGASVADRVKAVNDARTSAIQLLGGAALLAGLIFTAATYAVTRTTQRADRFSKSVAHLGDPNESVRTAGVYSLRLLGREDPNYWIVLEELLAAHIRERAVAGATPTSDVRAALNVLGTRVASEKPLDLRGVHIQRAEAVGANLANSWLDGARLANAEFTNASLHGATLKNATLTDAVFASTDLIDSDLTEADLQGADFYDAKVDNACIQGAKLAGAKNLAAEQLAVMRGTPVSMP